jgi:hypothetical protein
LYCTSSQAIIAAKYEKDWRVNRENVALIILARSHVSFQKKRKKKHSRIWGSQNGGPWHLFPGALPNAPNTFSAWYLFDLAHLRLAHLMLLSKTYKPNNKTSTIQ